MFDSVIASLMLPQKIIIEKGVDPAIPIERIERYSDNYLQLEYPANFGANDMPKKGNVISAIRFMGVDKVSRNDWTIDIDIRPAQKLSLEKVFDQNSKFFKFSYKGNTTVGGEKTIFLNCSLMKNVDSKVYFIVKNDKIFRIIINYYSPMKKDFLPAFEKVIASIRFK